MASSSMPALYGSYRVNALEKASILQIEPTAQDTAYLFPPKPLKMVVWSSQFEGLSNESVFLTGKRFAEDNLIKEFLLPLAEALEW